MYRNQQSSVGPPEAGDGQQMYEGEGEGGPEVKGTLIARLPKVSEGSVDTRTVPSGPRNRMSIMVSEVCRLRSVRSGVEGGDNRNESRPSQGGVGVCGR